MRTMRIATVAVLLIASPGAVAGDAGAASGKHAAHWRFATNSHDAIARFYAWPVSNWERRKVRSIP